MDINSSVKQRTRYQSRSKHCDLALSNIYAFNSFSLTKRACVCFSLSHSHSQGSPSGEIPDRIATEAFQDAFKSKAKPSTSSTFRREP